MKTPVIASLEYALPGAQSEDVFLSYMNREAARGPSPDAYTYYMGDPAKGANLFDVDGRPIDDVRGLRGLVNERAAEGIGFYKLVISYDSEFSAEHCPRGTEPERIKVEGRAVKQLARKMDLEDPVLVAAPHLNTDNDHSHWLLMDSKRAPVVNDRVYRLPADYVQKYRLLETASGEHLKTGSYTGANKKGNGRANYVFRSLKANIQTGNKAQVMIRSNFDVNADGSIDFRISDHKKNHTQPPKAAQLVGLESRTEMKVPEKALRVCRESIARDIAGDREGSIELRKYARETAQHVRELTTYSDPLADRLDALVDKLNASGVPRSKWQYGNNQLADLRPEINKLARDVVKEHDPKGYREFMRQLNMAPDDYVSSTTRDLDNRWGNAVLKAAQQRAADPQRIPPQPKKKRRSKPKPLSFNISKSEERAIQMPFVKKRLTALLCDNWEEQRANMAAYYRLQEEEMKSAALFGAAAAYEEQRNYGGR